MMLYNKHNILRQNQTDSDMLQIQLNMCDIYYTEQDLKGSSPTR